MNRQEAGRRRKKTARRGEKSPAGVKGGRRPPKKQPAGAMDAAHRRAAGQEAGRWRKKTARWGLGRPGGREGGQEAPKKQPAGAMDGPAGVKKVAGTGFERTRFSSGKTWNHQEPQRRLQRTSSRPRVVVAAWDRLPEPVRAGILAMVKASGG